MIVRFSAKLGLSLGRSLLFFLLTRAPLDSAESMANTAAANIPFLNPPGMSLDLAGATSNCGNRRLLLFAVFLAAVFRLHDYEVFYQFGP